MTPLIDTSKITEFHPNDAVQLLDRLGDLPSGAAGRIVGWFARSEPTYVVSFEGRQRCVEVHADQVELTTARAAA
ncbi:MAG TPA: hypothetical protein VFV62_05470 [Gaiellaceae bacterium]|nr:hypothetical protein [Gaiellaceae bacterium]